MSLREAAQAALVWMEASWHQIDKEWGPSNEEPDDDPVIKNLRDALAEEAEAEKAEPVALEKRIEEAFIDGFNSVRTYNDTVLNTVDEAWNEAKSSLLKGLDAHPAALPESALAELGFERIETLMADMRLDPGSDTITMTPRSLHEFARAVLAAARRKSNDK